MKCALCHEKDADKKNTHYLTDAIIRSCLNIDGSGDREKGFYFDVSNTIPGMEFNFQREAPIPEVETALGRGISGDDIEIAKSIPFSVDYVFCSDCEKIFTTIETAFIQKILPKFRQSDLTSVTNVNEEDVKNVRLFFYLQVWRTSVCEIVFSLTQDIRERLRDILLNYTAVEVHDLTQYPLTITYLETLKDNTANYVGFTSDSNPNFIIMNDFVIQFFDNQESIKFFDFYGLNDDSYKEYINYSEKAFNFKVIHHEDRLKILTEFMKREKVKHSIRDITDFFIRCWRLNFRVSPPSIILQEFMTGLIGDDESKALKYSEENIKNQAADFIWRKISSIK